MIDQGKKRSFSGRGKWGHLVEKLAGYGDGEVVERTPTFWVKGTR